MQDLGKALLPDPQNVEAHVARGIYLRMKENIKRPQKTFAMRSS